MGNIHNGAAYARIIQALCVSTLCLILIAGLWPFHAPRNGVNWLKSENGLHFGRYGSIISSGAFRGGDAQHDEIGSLEIWLEPGRMDDRNTILAFDGSGDRRVPFLLQQYDHDLILRHDVDDRRGISATTLLRVGRVFRQKERVFVTIALGKQSASVFVDGTLTNVSPISELASNSLTGRLVVANSPIADGSWSGQILGLAVYHRQLTSAEVVQHYESWTKKQQPAFTENEAPVAAYLFNERAGKTVHNLLDNATDLIIPEQYFVLHPPFLLSPWRAYDSNWSRWKDIGINVAGFIPFGFSLVAYFSSVRKISRPAATTLVLGFLLSLTIETLQTLLPTRDSDATDVITNTLGTAVGAMFYRWPVAQALLVRAGRCADSFLEDHFAGRASAGVEVGSGSRADRR
jgi:VanZ family protein